MEGRYNIRSPAVKRLMREAQELSEPTDQYFAQPLEDNLFEWHFTVRGPQDSDFQNGIYHGRIVLPPDYPMKPPSIIWLTPNGRFETNKKICLSISGHHPESWQPSWSIRTALLAIIGFMPSHPNGAIGSLNYKPEERKLLARKSREWKCPSCGDIQTVLLEPSTEPSNASQEAQELAAQINFQGEKPKNPSETNPAVTSASSAQVSSSTAAASETPSPQSVVSKTDSETKPSSSTTLAAPRPSPPPTAAPGLPTQTPHPGPHLPWAHTPVGLAQPLPVAAATPPFPWNAPLTGNTNVFPRFPYPPSQQYQANGFPGSFFPPAFLNMPPYPHAGMQPPPQPTTASLQSTSGTASASQDKAKPAVSSSSGTTNMTSLYVRERMVSPINATRIASPASTNRDNQDSELQSEPQQKDDQSHAPVFAELLDKVKRVGSEEAQPPQSDTASCPPQKADLNARKICKTEIVGDSSLTDELVDLKSMHTGGHTDSELSHSLRKKESHRDLTNADFSYQDMSVDGDDKSEAADLPLDLSEGGEPRLAPDVSASSPSPGQNLRLRSGKNLRQPQSATAHLPSEVSDEAEVVTGATGTARPIEAVSGDSQARPRPLPPLRLNQGAQTRGVIRNFPAHNEVYHHQQHFYNVVLAGLSLTVVLLLLNRLIQIIINL